MKIAVISDIHGNFEALLSVFDDIRSAEANEILCLGDFVGYGPQPEEVAQFLLKSEIPCVLGNHENAILHPSSLIHFNEDAMVSIEITRDLISKETLEYIANMKPNLILDDLLFVHGAPLDSFTDYITRLSDDRLMGIFEDLEQQVAFIGHTHHPLHCFCDGQEFEFDRLHQGTNPLDPKRKHIINVGSVGQPRDGNSDAKYVIFDDTDFTVDLRFVNYDIDKTANLLAKRNFPKFNAERLYQNWIEVPR
jgi:predicted phosphodiesterase